MNEDDRIAAEAAQVIALAKMKEEMEAKAKRDAES